MRVHPSALIDNEEYIIERKIIRKLTKVGDHTVSNKLEFYKKNGFIQKPGNQMIWTPSEREIYDFIKKYPTLFPIITQKWSQYSMEYIRERKRLQLLGLMEEAQYEKNAGTYKRRNRSHVKKDVHQKRTLKNHKNI